MDIKISSEVGAGLVASRQTYVRRCHLHDDRRFLGHGRPPHTIDRWDDATGELLVEQIAAVGDYLVAVETDRAAIKRWPKDKITLRNRARVIEQSWED